MAIKYNSDVCKIIKIVKLLSVMACKNFINLIINLDISCVKWVCNLDCRWGKNSFWRVYRDRMYHRVLYFYSVWNATDDDARCRKSTKMSGFESGSRSMFYNTCIFWTSAYRKSINNIDKKYLPKLTDNLIGREYFLINHHLSDL